MRNNAVVMSSLIGGLVVISAVGIYALGVVEKDVRSDVNNRIQTANGVVAAIVDASDFEKLSFDESDLDRLEYVWLREKFRALGEVFKESDKYRGVYTMKNLGDSVVFVVDSGPDDDPWHVPSGTVYEEPPQELFDTINDGQMRLAGPYTDDYGSFYSVFSPLEIDRGDIIVGTDVDVNVYDALVKERMIIPELVLLSVILAYLLLFGLAERYHRSVREARERSAAKLEEAIEASRAKSDFVSAVVHQLKTPLTALRWSVEMLEAIKKERTTEEGEMFDQVVMATGRLNNLVRSLLNIGRIESGRLKIEPKPTDLVDLVKDVVLEMEETTERRKQNITIGVSGALPVINVDPTLVRELYKNLLTNAAKYSPNGKTIDVRIELAGDRIISSVSDSGHGIPEAEQKHIFEMFFRASNVVKLPEEGTGIGLHFARQIARVSGGDIWFKSKEGEGTTFFFSLPVAGSQANMGEMNIDSV